MVEVFKEIILKYIDETKKDKAQNKLANFIEKDAPESFYNTGVINRKQYLIKGSAGKGQWAFVPWIAVLDRDITITAKEGYYIVYLFSADMKKVYLSLNQGWTYFKEQYGRKRGKDKIKIISRMLQEKLKSGLDEFNTTDIDLEYKGNGSDLPKGYELGHICGKVYDANNLPSEDILIEDLQNMISVYRELKGYILENDYLTLNNSLLAEEATSTKEDKKEDKESIAINEILANEGLNTKLVKSDKLPKIFQNKIEESNESYNSRNQKTDYQKKSKNQERIGRAGEYFVIEHEKNKLLDFSINKEIEHVAITQNDKAGYDIKSYDEHGEEIYIEVKATKGNIDTPFYLTKKELLFSKQHADRYYLYRVYNLKPSEKTGEYYIIEGDISKSMNLETETYIVNGRKNIEEA